MLDKIFEEAFQMASAGETFAIATVVRAERPTSAKTGAKALITADGKLTG